MTIKIKSTNIICTIGTNICQQKESEKTVKAKGNKIRNTISTNVVENH